MARGAKVGSGTIGESVDAALGRARVSSPAVTATESTRAFQTDFGHHTPSKGSTAGDEASRVGGAPVLASSSSRSKTTMDMMASAGKKLPGATLFQQVLEYLELTPWLLALHGAVFFGVLSLILQDKIREKAHEEASISFFAKSGFKIGAPRYSSQYETAFECLSFAKIVLRSLCFTFALFRFLGARTREEKSATERESWLGYFISNAFTALWPASTRGVLAIFCFAVSRGLVENLFFVVQYLEIVNSTTTPASRPGSTADAIAAPPPALDDSVLVCEVFDAVRSVFLKSILIVGLFVGHRYIQSENEPEEYLSWATYMATFGTATEQYDPNDIRSTHMMSTPHQRQDRAFGPSKDSPYHSPIDRPLPDEIEMEPLDMSGTSSLPLLSASGVHQPDFASSTAAMQMLRPSPTPATPDVPERKRRTLSDEAPDTMLYAHLADNSVATDKSSRGTPDLHGGGDKSPTSKVFQKSFSETLESGEVAGAEPIPSPRSRGSSSVPSRPPSPMASPNEPPPVDEKSPPATWHGESTGRTGLDGLFPGSLDNSGTVSATDQELNGAKRAPSMGNKTIASFGLQQKASPLNPSPSADDNSFDDLFAKLGRRHAHTVMLPAPEVPLHTHDVLLSGAGLDFLDPLDSSNTWSHPHGQKLLQHAMTAQNLSLGTSSGAAAQGSVHPDREVSGESSKSPGAAQRHRPATAASTFKNVPALTTDRNWFLIQPRKPWQPRQLWRKLRFCVFGLDPFSQSLNSYAQYFAGFILLCSLFECVGEVFLFQTVDRQTWLGRRLITGNWRHAVYVALFYPLETLVLFGLLYFVRTRVLVVRNEDNGSSTKTLSKMGISITTKTNTKTTTVVDHGNHGSIGNTSATATASTGLVAAGATGSSTTPAIPGRSPAFSSANVPPGVANNDRHWIFVAVPAHWSRIFNDLVRGLICFGLILMSHRVCSGMLSFFITIECKHIENDINQFVLKWRSYTRKQRQERYQKLSDRVRILDKKLFAILHFVFSEHVMYIALDAIDARCALTRARHLGLFVLRHLIGVCLACVAMWHAGVVNYAIYEGVWSKVERERLHLRDDQVLYRRELKDWTSFLAHASRWSRSVCIRLFWMRYALTSNVVMGLIVSLVLWPAIAKIVLAIG
ncbi:unnamed protein product [Amoebophrya sp. A120]|nr:unnamed protein product [Amoebophrya sp. A120]|eukprot:GSA120T00002052001.1